MNAAEYRTAFEVIEGEMLAGRMGIPHGCARIALLSFELDQGDAPAASTLAIGRADREDFLSHAVITAAVAKVKAFDAPELIAYWTKESRDLYLAVQAYLLAAR